jgi:sortase (surface protein transpeptidase)
METENVTFKIELYSTYWDKKPNCTISINDKLLWSGDIDGTKEKPNVISFEHELSEGKKYELLLNRQGKDIFQTVVENGEIKKDQLLHIKSLEIDDIDISSLVYEGVYTPQYPQPWANEQKQKGKELPKTLKNVTQMGHNGTWAFTFTSPFYMWLLENLY